MPSSLGFHLACFLNLLPPVGGDWELQPIYAFLSFPVTDAREADTSQLAKPTMCSGGAGKPLVGRQLRVLRHVLGLVAQGQGKSQAPRAHVAARCKSWLPERMQVENQNHSHIFPCCSW